MKKFLVAVAAVSSLLACAGFASAADPVTDLPYDWSGLYISANVGGAWNESSWQSVGTPFETFDTDGSGLIYGGQIGYNYQFDNIVLGIEGNLASVDLTGKADCAGASPTCKTEQDWIGSVRGRLGLAVDRFHLYGTGGIAFTEYDFSESVSLVQSWGGGSRTGWTAGLGAEYALTDNWITGIQWDYYDFGSKVGDGGSSPASIRFDETENTLTFRIGYKF